MNKYHSKQKGFLELIVIVLIALILLRFLNIDIKAILAKEWVKDFFGYIRDTMVIVWQDAVAIFNAVRGK